jgi:hypothetical protein
MTSKTFLFLIAAFLLVLPLATPELAAAQTTATQDIVVEPNPPSGSGHFSTIQAAITQAQALINANPQLNNNLRIVVNGGTYTGIITPISNVPIISSSSSGTSGTFISGAGTVVNLSGVTNVSISNFTFQNGAGITIANSSVVNINNIVFALNGSGTAVRVTNVQGSVAITNNTFYNGGVAISTDSDIPIINNIFNRNGTAIQTQRALTQVLYNAFYANGADGIVFDKTTNLPNTQHPGVDPMFVNPPNDFRLQQNSPAKGTGDPDPRYRNSFNNSSDIGAYGGPSAELGAPAMVTGVTSTLLPGPAIQVNWNASTDSTVTSYLVYYGNTLDLTGRDADQGASPIAVTTGTTLTLTGFSTTPPAVPAAPQVTGIMPSNGGLLVSWSAVPGATGYRVYVSTSSIADATSLVPVTVGNVTSTQIKGLVNGTTYFIRVAAIAQDTIFIGVKAVASSSGRELQGPLSALTSQGIGDIKVSPLSNEVHDFPEATTAFPNLNSQGCFIATAAYGFYSAPQVQALRIFRDRYLMTNAPGRAFVAWYYRVGPRGAAYLNAHPWLKPPVRVALLPLVAVSIFLVYTPFLLKIAMALVTTVMLLFLKQRREKKMQLAAGRVL